MSRTEPFDPAAANRTGQAQIVVLPTIGRRILTVTRIEDVTPRYRRIVFGGPDLAGGFPIRRFAPTDHVKLFFPDPASGELVVPEITAAGWQVPEGAVASVFRDYTVRAFDAETGELAIDFVLHDHGIAGVWAGAARPGDSLGQLGPRGTVLFPEDYPHYLAAGDATAIPAVARIVEEAPAGSRVTAVIEVADAAEQQTIRPAAGVDADIRWVHSDAVDREAGHLSALETALRAVPVDTDERVFAFAAGEATALKPIRRYLRNDLGLAKYQVDVDGYWKKGVANLDHHADEIDED